MKALTFALVLCGLAAALASGPASAADDYVVHTFKCPDLTHVRLNWTNKISANPDFPVAKEYENLRHSAKFKESAVSVSDNTVRCLYVLGDTVFQAPYVYKVHRKILGCTGQPGKEMKCNLKKD
ncbi:MAG: hypothetical protein HYU26_01725 [Candidatus Rokubacteria bacterium]|nr:hypothetical protein [Candidatus Rokubacteria bacterium]